MSSRLRFVFRAWSPLGLALAAGCATLHGPEQRGEASVVAERVSEGADIEARDEGGNTPLHLAARYGRESVVEVLLAAGADAGARNDQGATPLHYWGLGRHSDTTVASALLAAGADVDAQARDGATPLHWAAGRGARAARSSRSSSSAMDSLERTARIPVAGAAAAVAAAPIVGLITLLEAFIGRPQPVENTTVLVDGGARVESRDSRGNTPVALGGVVRRPGRHGDGAAVGRGRRGGQERGRGPSRRSRTGRLRSLVSAGFVPDDPFFRGKRAGRRPESACDAIH